ncbi:MAG: sulfate adenylyltransferase [Candidatus Thermoplasmatota archaeon]|nr:sulfate adenylyltransferase [Candidatus Thermoplasmatota archaeon]
MSKPHGGTLINRMAPDGKKERLREESEEMKSITLNSELRKDVHNIAHGVYSPLTGFFSSEDFDSVIEHSRLSDDLPWTLPIVLDVPEEKAEELNEGEEICLKTKEGDPLAILDIDDIYTFDKDRMAENIYGTTDIEHPGVEKTRNMDDYLVGGDILQIKDKDTDFEKYHLVPKETRVLFKEKGWRQVVGFQTRNVPHMGHEYVQRTALTFVDGIFINPIIGKKKKGDYRDEVILDAYDTLMDEYFLKNRAVMSILEAEMRYAGPKEAVFHAIMRKNFGCTHFIVGRDHAGVGDYYGPYEAQDIFDEFPDLGITPVFFKSFTYCEKCGGAVDGHICPHGDEYRENFSGTKMRNMFKDGKKPPERMMRPEVAESVLKQDKKFVE